MFDVCPLSAALLLLLPSAQEIEAPRPEVGAAVRELTLHEPPGTRVEHFRIDPQDAQEAPIGTMRLLVGPDPEAALQGALGMRLEADTTFFAEQVRVLHAERVRFEGAEESHTLVWREIRPQAGRTVLIEGSKGGLLRSMETVGGEILRRVHAGSKSSTFPLVLVEAVRSGEKVPSLVRIYQPLVGEYEEITVQTYLDSAEGGEEQVLQLTRPNGDSAGRYVFRAGRLVSFQLQSGGPIARSVSRVDYEGIHQEHANERSDGTVAVR